VGSDKKGWIDRQMKSARTIDECFEITERSSENLKELWAAKYLEIECVVSSMGGWANFRHWIRNHALKYFKTCKELEKKLQAEKAKVEMLKNSIELDIEWNELSPEAVPEITKALEKLKEMEG
jgi:predicted RNase H-like nuclease (RuvC/YqgF family)